MNSLSIDELLLKIDSESAITVVGALAYAFFGKLESFALCSPDYVTRVYVDPDLKVVTWENCLLKLHYPTKHRLSNA